MNIPRGWSLSTHRHVSELDERDWELLVPRSAGGFFCSYGWLDGFASDDGFLSSITALRDQDGRLAAAVLLGICDWNCNPAYDLDSLFPPRLADAEHRWKPQLLIGAHQGYGNEILVRDERLVPLWFEIVREQVDKFSCINAAMPYLGASALGRLRAALPCAPVVLTGVRAQIPIRGSSFTTHLEKLRGSNRRMVNIDQRKLIKSGRTVEVTARPSGLARLAPLVANLERKYGTDLQDDMYIDYLTRFESRALRDRLVLFECKAGGRTVAFSLAIEYGRVLISHVVGIDYERTGQANEYHNVFINYPVRYAIERGLICVDLGTEAYRPKLLRGGRLIPLWSAVLRMPDWLDQAIFQETEARLLARWTSEVGEIVDMQAMAAMAQAARVPAPGSRDLPST
jgi:Acetyltransferase (GNAT) domain